MRPRAAGPCRALVARDRLVQLDQPGRRVRSQLVDEGELVAPPRAVEQRDPLRGCRRSDDRASTRSGAMPVPPATNSSQAAGESAGSVNVPNGPSTSNQLRERPPPRLLPSEPLGSRAIRSSRCPVLGARSGEQAIE